jgi:hypothetical protein
MRMTPGTRLLALAGSMLLFAGPASAQGANPPVAGEPVIETIAFDGVPLAEHQAILDRIGLRAGDRLTVPARHRIGRRLNVLGDARTFSYTNEGLTFSDRPGSKPGRVILVIAAGC